MEAIGPVVAGVAVKLGAQVGADLHFGQLDAEALEMLEQPGAGQAGIGLGQLGGIGEEDGPGGFVAQSVLEAGQALGLHLGPVMGDVIEELGVHLPAAQGGMLGLDPAQVRLSAVLLRAWTQQPGVAQDPVDGSLADRQLKVLDQTPGSEAGGALAGGDRRTRRRFRAAAGLAARAPGVVLEPIVTPLQEAPKPQAHRVAAAAKAPPGGTDSVRLGINHQFAPQSEVIVDGRFHGPVKSEPRVRFLGVHNLAFILEAPDPHSFSRQALPLGGGLASSAPTPPSPSPVKQSAFLSSSLGQDLYRSVWIRRKSQYLRRAFSWPQRGHVASSVPSAEV